MAKSIATSCPLCLCVNDPLDMLPVAISHSTPPQTEPLHLCRRCVLEIVKCAMASELIDPQEVFPNVANSAPAAPDAGSGAPSPEADRPVVLQGEPGAEGPAVDRLESEVPAGGGKAESADEQQGAVSARARRVRGGE